MTSPSASETVPVILVAGGLTTLLGHDLTFWIVVLAATILKMITSEKSTSTGWFLIREKFVHFLAGIIPPFVATKGVAAWLEIENDEIILLIAVLLVVMGDGIVRWLTKISSNPKILVEFIKTWRGTK